MQWNYIAGMKELWYLHSHRVLRPAIKPSALLLCSYKHPALPLAVFCDVIMEGMLISAHLERFSQAAIGLVTQSCAHVQPLQPQQLTSFSLSLQLLWACSTQRPLLSNSPQYTPQAYPQANRGLRQARDPFSA